jgi:hypothetical protein
VEPTHNVFASRCPTMTERPKLMKCTVRAKAGKVDGGSGSHARVVKAPAFLDNNSWTKAEMVILTWLVDINIKDGQTTSTNNR